MEAKTAQGKRLLRSRGRYSEREPECGSNQQVDYSSDNGRDVMATRLKSLMESSFFSRSVAKGSQMAGNDPFGNLLLQAPSMPAHCQSPTNLKCAFDSSERCIKTIA